MRQNKFSKADSWEPWGSSTDVKFYDVTFFSSDSIIVGKEFGTLVEMYFRVNSDKIVHNREVFTMMNWLGSIGGIQQVLMDLFIFFFGGYAQFNAIVQTFGKFSVLEIREDGEEAISQEELTVRGMSTLRSF